MLASRIETVDHHTGGEPFRILAEPPVAIPGATVAERRARAIEDPDVQALRAVLCSEPRGHADVYGGLIVPPDDAEAHLGVLFRHEGGLSTACGHGTIVLGVWAVDTGLVAAPETGSDTAGQVHQRNVAVFADGEVDRSPCGSGTCARLAVLHADGGLPAGTVLRHDSIVGSTFTGTVLDTVGADGRRAVLPQVTGMAYRTGEHVFPIDPLVPGVVLR
jgi:proline racemase